MQREEIKKLIREEYSKPKMSRRVNRRSENTENHSPNPQLFTLFQKINRLEYYELTKESSNNKRTENTVLTSIENKYEQKSSKTSNDKSESKSSKSCQLGQTSTNRLHSELSAEINEYYDQIKNSIDIKAQEIFLLIEKEKSNKCKKNKQLSEYRRELLRINESNAEYIDQMCQNNIDQLNEYFSNDKSLTTDKQYIKSNAFKSHCVYIDRQEMCKYFRLKYPLGVIISSDWYLSKQECNFLRSQFKYAKIQFVDPENNMGVFNLDSKLVNLTTSFYKQKDSKECEHESPIKQIDNVLYLTNQSFTMYCKAQKELSVQIEGLLVNHLIKCVKDDAFVNFTNLEKLVINKNIWNCPTKKVCKLEPNAFNGLSNLKVLDMYHMKISSTLSFERLVNLEELHMAKFKLDELKFDQFKALVNLKVLNLSESIVTFEDNFFQNLNKLESLNFCESFINQYDDSLFKGLENLTHLNLINTVFDQDDGNDEEREDTIKNVLANFQNLKKLEISWDDFVALKSCESLLNKLEEINFNFLLYEQDDNSNHVMNELKKNENLIKSMTNLKKLTFSFHTDSNGDFTVSEKLFRPFKNVDLIESLELSGHTNGCNIKANSFKMFKNLKSLNLNGIQIEDIDRHTFNGLVNLESLDLSHNPMQSIPEYTFSKLVNLKSVSLIENELRGIDPNAFHGCKKISNINLEKSVLGIFISQDVNRFKRALGLKDSVQILFDKMNHDEPEISESIEEHLLEGELDEDDKEDVAFRILQLIDGFNDTRFKYDSDFSEESDCSDEDEDENDYLDDGDDYYDEDYYEEGDEEDDDEDEDEENEAGNGNRNCFLQ